MSDSGKDQGTYLGRVTKKEQHVYEYIIIEYLRGNTAPIITNLREARRHE